MDSLSSGAVDDSHRWSKGTDTCAKHCRHRGHFPERSDEHVMVTCIYKNKGTRECQAMQMSEHSKFKVMSNREPEDENDDSTSHDLVDKYINSNI